MVAFVNAWSSNQSQRYRLPDLAGFLTKTVARSPGTPTIRSQLSGPIVARHISAELLAKLRNHHPAPGLSNNLEAFPTQLTVPGHRARNGPSRTEVTVRHLSDRRQPTLWLASELSRPFLRGKNRSTKVRAVTISRQHDTSSTAKHHGKVQACNGPRTFVASNRLGPDHHLLFTLFVPLLGLTPPWLSYTWQAIWGQFSAFGAPRRLLTVGSHGLYLLSRPFLRPHIHLRTQSSARKNNQGGKQLPCSMAGCLSSPKHGQTGVLGQVVVMLCDHLYITFLVAVLVVTAPILRLRRRLQNISPDTKAWIEEEKAFPGDDKPLIGLTTSLPTPVSRCSHPLADSLFQQAGIPTSGDIARRQLFNKTITMASNLNSGDIAVLSSNPSTDLKHPWRRHSHPQPPSHDHLTGSENEAVIKEDVLEFFRDEAIGKLWRRRTLEFGSIQAPAS